MKKLFLLFIIFSTPIMLFAQELDIQGHRGARGKMPENSLPAFIYALDQGVTTLELDLAISKDKKVVVSHEPWMNHSICFSFDGEQIKEEDEKKHNLYQMDYETIKKYDCGSVPSKRFPQQVKMKTVKPLLVDVIKAAEKHTKGVTHFEVNYNIEIKSSEKGDGVFHPEIDEFSDLVYQLIDQYLPWERVTIQSFDERVLKYWHQKYPIVTLVFLTEKAKSVEANLKSLGFTPDIYSPYHILLTKGKVEKIHDLDMKVIPWTVNDKETMQKLISWKVDGIITDYPDRAAALGLTRGRTKDD